MAKTLRITITFPPDPANHKIIEALAKKAIDGLVDELLEKLTAVDIERRLAVQDPGEEKTPTQVVKMVEEGVAVAHEAVMHSVGDVLDATMVEIEEETIYTDCPGCAEDACDAVPHNHD